MENIKVSLSSDFGTLADIWAPLTLDDIEWFNTMVVEDYTGTFDLDRHFLTIFVPNEDDVYTLRSLFNNIAA